uniref:Glyceraldehyde-3-phosphate dehydrogenase n=1 Tax=uncultured Thiotrichaceae bacterium TaxID=298394 RepID=A0A6S6UDC8_9GAMM|nr:MAG: NADPH-dependent glyceraldehyde-3-phosphate dehydrogenase (EC [uncultured Thiotrichaceae bacterium]
MTDDNSVKHLENYMNSQSLAEEMIPAVGNLYRKRNVIVTIFGRKLMNSSTIEIIKAHKLGRHMVGRELPVDESHKLLETMKTMDLGVSRIDIGKLANQYAELQKENAALTLTDFLNDKLASVNHGKLSLVDKPQDVVLYGFGRIGRILARMLIERTTLNNKLRLRAIVVRGGREGDLEKRASLLRRDSVHGPFNGSITVDQENSSIVANGTCIKVIYANKPEDIDYRDYDINDALIVDNTGMFKDREGLSRHLAPGAKKVLLTAPAKGDIDNIVYGVNEAMISDDDTVVCAASCTTNAITPILKVMNDEFGIVNGHVETIHSYTNDQNLIDNYHSAPRRGRSAPLNMVLTSTGAAKAVSKALPELEGKLTGNAIRVPTPNVSMAVINLNLNKATTREALNEHVRKISLDSNLSEQISFSTSTEAVSTDMVGTPEPGVFDSEATIVQDNSCVLYVWYDNEYGYSSQVMKVMRHMTGLNIPALPA